MMRGSVTSPRCQISSAATMESSSESGRWLWVSAMTATRMTEAGAILLVHEIVDHVFAGERREHFLHGAQVDRVLGVIVERFFVLEAHCECDIEAGIHAGPRRGNHGTDGNGRDAGDGEERFRG